MLLKRYPPNSLPGGHQRKHGAKGVKNNGQGNYKGTNPESIKTTLDKYPNDPSGGKDRKIIRFDFTPGASPEEIAKALNEMVKKYRKGSEPENPAKEDSSVEKP